VDRIGWLGKGELNIGSFETNVSVDCFLYKVEAIVFVKKRVRLFERVERGNNKPNAVDCGLVQNMVCNDEMANMDRIEGTEIEAYFHAIN
jgi:hypothetical protein